VKEMVVAKRSLVAIHWLKAWVKISQLSEWMFEHVSAVFDIKKYEISHINAFIRALPPVKSILSKYNS